MRIFLLLISLNCFALETVICTGSEESYKCYTYSEHEPQYYENVINVYESEGFSENDSNSQNSESFTEKTELPSYIFIR